MNIVRKYGLGLIAFSTVVTAAFIWTFLRWHDQDTVASAIQEARNYYLLNRHYRAWNASLGGVYAPIDKVAPNPYLEVPGRDLVLADGTGLTLINPAYMTRMVFERAAASAEGPISSKLISLNPLNPGNSANKWEAEALRSMEMDKASELTRVQTIDGQEYLQFLGPFVTESSCLKCHEKQGYKVGDLRGAISITISMADYRAAEGALNRRFVSAMLLGWSGFSLAWVKLSKRRFEKELALQLSEERNRTIFELSQAGIFMIDPDGTITVANRSAGEIFGCSPDELIGKRYAELVDDDERDLAEKRLMDLIHGNASAATTEDRCFRRRDGSTFWGHVGGRRLENSKGQLVSLVGVVTDVTPMRQIIEELNQAKDYFFSILNALADPVFVKDDRYRLVLVNDAECRMLGRDRSDILGKTDDDLFSGEEATLFRHYDRLVLQTGETHINQEEIVFANGQRKVLMAHKSCYVDQAGKRYVVGILRDVTEQKNLEHRAIRNAQLAAVGQLASGVAHEINNPITGVINCAQLLLNRNAVDEQNQPVLARIIREGDRVAAIVRSLLFFSRDSGEETAVVDIRTLLVDVLQLLSDQLAKDGIDLQLNLPDVVVMIKANPQQIEQVMLNLLSNARYALNESGRAEKKLILSVDLLRETQGSVCRISVYDNGTGISDALLGRLGQPFVTTKPAGVGTGLGLSISQEIIKRHGGELRIASQEGEFTEIAVDLPAV
jgi:PAS domain S-box-containing protein